MLLEAFVPDLAAPDRPFRPGLRVKGVAARPGVFEMTWDNDGRATFSYGPEHVPGQPHVIWRRIGTHAILTPPRALVQVSSPGGARASEAAGEHAVRDVLERSLAQFRDPQTGVVTLRNTFRWWPHAGQQRFAAGRGRN